jgi:hypothetical protein
MTSISRHVAVGAATLLALPLVCAALPALGHGAEDTKTASQIFADASAAMEQISSFHVVGSVQSQGTTVTVNLSLGHGKGGGTIGLPGVTMDMVLGGGFVYIKADKQSWLKLTGSKSTAALVAGRWIKASVTSSDFGDFAQLADSKQFITGLKSQGALTRLPGTYTWDGHKSVVIEDSTHSELYIADTGTPYMLYLESPSKGKSGSITFADFGDAPIPAVPEKSITLPGV